MIWRWLLSSYEQAWAGINCSMNLRSYLSFNQRIHRVSTQFATQNSPTVCRPLSILPKASLANLLRQHSLAAVFRGQDAGRLVQYGQSPSSIPFCHRRWLLQYISKYFPPRTRKEFNTYPQTMVTQMPLPQMLYHCLQTATS